MIRDICEHVKKEPDKFGLGPGRIAVFHLGPSGEVNFTGTLLEVADFIGEWDYALKTELNEDDFSWDNDEFYIGIVHEDGAMLVSVPAESRTP